ncbi:YciI family protein [Dyella flava]|uniref:YciI family protein n=1 Tax=Dyella flava TaxID=1920170 RepID=A0ABS2K2B5_9GAMM|nr:YciI family protein [Dyella flava]MBM7125044.1 YciI family protein [Dyella flava]GLQ52328.1 dehydrogenase [Dyella flava]
MRAIVLVKATEESEKGTVAPEWTAEMMQAMGKFNDELSKAGVLVMAEGLTPSAQGKRVGFKGTGRAVIDGPFAETRELVAGFWIWNVKDMDEAVAWVKRCPNPMPGPSEIEIRPIYEMADWP